MSLKGELAGLDTETVAAAVDGFLAKQLTGNNKLSHEVNGGVGGPYSGLNEAVSLLMSHVTEADPFGREYSETIIEAIGMGVRLFAGVITEAAEIKEAQAAKEGM
jgi:hypothetical protein